jgi:hypothetical protein
VIGAFTFALCLSCALKLAFPRTAATVAFADPDDNPVPAVKICAR